MSYQRTPGNPQVDRLRYLLALASGNGGTPFPNGTGLVGVLASSPELVTSFFDWAIPDFYVDPQNASGHASDTNDGLTPTTPIRTTAKFNSRIFFHNVSVHALVHYLSDDDVSAVVDLSMTTALDYQNASLKFVGAPHVLHTGTLSAVTPADPATKTRATIADSSFDFSSLLHNVLFITSGANAGNAAWLASGTTAPDITAPMDPLGDGVATFTVGDPYQVQRGSVLTLAPMNPFLGNLIFEDFAFTTASLGPAQDQSPNSFVQYNRCSWAIQLSVAGIYTNCFAPSGMQMVGVPLIIGGLYVSTHFDVCTPLAQFDGDCYITGFGLVISPNSYQATTLSASIGTSVQFQDTTGPAAIQAWGHLNCGNAPGGGGTSIVWGTGNAGVGLLVGPGVLVSVADSNVPSVTGTGGDIGFVAPNSSALVTNARTVAEDGTIGASHTASWANLANAGSLDFQAHYLPTNAAVVGVSNVF